MSNQRGTLRQAWTALKALLVLTVALGIIYPLAMTGLGQVMFNHQANGSLIEDAGTVVGSRLIGQSFTTKKGAALPQWFQSRPSAAGDGYDGGASSGSNYGPNSRVLEKQIRDRQEQIAKLDGVSVGQIPPDAVTASGSGLDPDISPAYALLQATRVAEARGLDGSAVRALVESKIQARELGYIGEPVVNVLQLNLALAKLK
jgi:K+-transporting ATPase ATPase C chain